MKTLQERGVAVRSLTDGIDPSTSSGKMVLGVLATLAEYERDLIRERVNAGIAAARAREHPPRFGRPPLDPGLVAEKLAIAGHAREAGKTAAQAASLVGWSRATLYRHMAEQPTGSTDHQGVVHPDEPAA